MDVAWRGITHDDVPAWTALLAAAEKVDRTGEHYNDADLHEELDEPDVALEDRVAAWAGKQLVAFAAVRERSADGARLRIFAEGTVHPDHRGQGLGSAGLGWVERRSRELQGRRRPPLTVGIEVTAGLDNQEQVALLEAAGYTAVNWSATMRADLRSRAPTGPRPGWAAGYRIEPFTLPRSSAVLAAHNAAFTDHWGFTPWSPNLWRQYEEESRNARHDMSWLLVPEDDDETVAGYVLTHEYDAYQQATGRREAYVAKVGVRREHRGRGLASGLLRNVLVQCAAAGYDEAALDVDTNNPTGAFGLYERAGFTVERRTATFELTLPVPSPGGR